MRLPATALRAAAVVCFAFVASVETSTATDEPALKIARADAEQAFTIAQLTSRLDSEIITFVHPYYEKEKSFEALPLGPLLKTLFAGSTEDTDGLKVRLEALDGYQSVTPWSTCLEPGGYLVFRDADDPQWEKMKNRDVSPGPFAVVWTGQEQVFDNGYPWTWQIETIRLVRE